MTECDDNDALQTFSDVAAKYAADQEKALCRSRADGGRSQIASLVQDPLSPISGELATSRISLNST